MEDFAIFCARNRHLFSNVPVLTSTWSKEKEPSYICTKTVLKLCNLGNESLPINLKALMSQLQFVDKQCFLERVEKLCRCLLLNMGTNPKIILCIPSTLKYNDLWVLMVAYEYFLKPYVIEVTENIFKSKFATQDNYLTKDKMPYFLYMEEYFDGSIINIKNSTVNTNSTYSNDKTTNSDQLGIIFCFAALYTTEKHHTSLKNMLEDSCLLIVGDFITSFTFETPKNDTINCSKDIIPIISYYDQSFFTKIARDLPDLQLRECDLRSLLSDSATKMCLWTDSIFSQIEIINILFFTNMEIISSELISNAFVITNYRKSTYPDFVLSVDDTTPVIYNSLIFIEFLNDLVRKSKYNTDIIKTPTLYILNMWSEFRAQIATKLQAKRHHKKNIITFYS